MNDRALTHIGLFTGIGGFELACRWAGFTTLAVCERDEYCRAVIGKNFPGIPVCEDVNDFAEWFVSRFGTVSVDLVTGGFPCQDTSFAGEGAGIHGERSGLWFPMLGVVTALRPRFLVAENVPGLFGRGLDTVLAGLEQAGYRAEAFVLGAWAVGAPHRRDRIFIVAERIDGKDDAMADTDDVRQFHVGLGAPGYGRGDGREPQRFSEKRCGDAEQLADPYRLRERQPQGGIGDKRGRTRDGGQSVGVAQGDTDREQQQEQRQSLADGTELPSPRCTGEDVDDANGESCHEARFNSGGVEPQHADSSRTGRGASESRLGGAFAGLPCGMDGRAGIHTYPAHIWPAFCGEAQKEGEPARLTTGGPNRSRRLHALGNALVPEQAYAIIKPVADCLRRTEGVAK